MDSCPYSSCDLSETIKNRSPYSCPYSSCDLSETNKNRRHSVKSAKFSIVHDGVQITPGFIEFTDAAEGIICRKRVTIRNIGVKPARVRIRKPNSIAFQVKATNTSVFLNPGLKLTTWVTYVFKIPAFLRATIPIEINGKLVDYRVTCALAHDLISVNPGAIDFGTIDVGYSSGIKIITISNVGGKRTRFSIDLGVNELGMSVKPMRGIVRRDKKLSLRVELIGINEGVFFSEFWIKSTPNIRVPIKVNVIIPRLVVYHPNATGDFTLIDFPPTLENTRRFSSFVLRNVSSQVSSYVVLVEINGEFKCLHDIDRNQHPIYRVFDIHPIEGRMEPFEGTIFEVGFSPTSDLRSWRQRSQQSWRTKQLNDNDSSENDFMAFVRIVRVHCTETEDILRYDPVKELGEESAVTTPPHETYMYLTESTISTYTSTTDAASRDLIKFCLFGEVETPRLKFVPDKLYFGELMVGETNQRVIQITNTSSTTPMCVKYVNNAIVHCTPQQYWLKPNGAIEVLVHVYGKHYNVASSWVNIVFDVIADSYDSSIWRQKIKVKVDSYKIKCMLTVKNKPMKFQVPQFTMGITPLRTNEVGFNTEKATFGSAIPKPRQAMLGVEKQPGVRTWANEKLIRAQIEPDSVPSYPNDMQRSLRPYKGPTVKTIFTGIPRYIGGPICSESYTPKEAAQRAEHRVYWATYLKELQRKSNWLSGKGIGEEEDNYVIKKVVGACQNGLQDFKRILMPYEPYAKEKKLQSKVRAEMLPLSPMQIYNVHIIPTMFAFGSVALRTRSYKQLIVENRNDFPVMVRLVSLPTKFINFPEGDVIFLNADSVVTKLVEFYADHLGKYNGYMDYVINDSHSYELSITADVVTKQLVIENRDIVMGTDWMPLEAYRPMEAFIEIRNKLDARTSFAWEMLSNSAFVLEPSAGWVRGNRTLYVYAAHNPHTTKANYTEAKMNCENGGYSKVHISASQHASKVNFVEDVLNLGDIPLNITTVVYAVMKNYKYEEVVFEVDSSSLVQGCTVYPTHGKIHPCGIVVLEVHVKFDACLQFAIVIRVIAQKCVPLPIKLIGHVVYPKLKLTPQSIDVKRVSADAFQCYPLTVSNIGTTVAEVKFMLAEYPEFHVSASPSRTYPDVGSRSITIMPGMVKTLYLQFEPVDPASYAFFVPIIINDMLGPPIQTDPKTLRSATYVKPRESYYAGLQGFMVLKPHPKLPTISIDCTVAGHVLSFRKLIYQFDASNVEDELSIENLESERTASVLFRTDAFLEPDCPFAISWTQRGVKPIVTPSSITVTLKSGEGTFLKVEFKPIKRGFFSIEAPIFIRGELEGNMFNKLRLDGSYPECTIESEVYEIFFMPMPLRTTAEEKFRLTAKYFESPEKLVLAWMFLQPDRCTGSYDKDLFMVELMANDKTRQTSFVWLSNSSNNRLGGSISNVEFEVKLTVSSEKSFSCCQTIRFYDQHALAQCLIKVYVVMDDSLLTTHAYQNMHARNQNKYTDKLSSCTSMSLSSDDDDDDWDREDATSQYAFSNRKQGESSVGKLSGYTFTDKSRLFSDENIDDDDFEEESFFLRRAPMKDAAHSTTSSLRTRGGRSKLVYPCFPTDTRYPDYEKHMDRTLSAAEEWLYTGVCKFSFYPTVFEGITATFANLIMKKRRSHYGHGKEKLREISWSYVDILETLVGPTIFEHIGRIDHRLPEDNLERIKLILRTYEKILGFLSAQGACFPHISAYYLLTYKDYVTSFQLDSTSNETSRRKSLMEGETICDELPKNIFESHSKQCWLDLILQTYKCLILSRVSDRKLSARSTSISLYGTRRSTCATQKLSLKNSMLSIVPHLELAEEANRAIVQAARERSARGNHSYQEGLLLAWLQHHYDIQRKEDWLIDRRIILNPRESRDVARVRNIENFDNDLSDCMVLLAVTAAYCPFLIDEFFGNIYVTPRNYEEAMHNAICVVKAWRLIRLGFMITPVQIVQSNSVQMLMLVVHLFEMLPTYLPKAKIKFGCPLTESIVRQLTLTNPSDHSIDYLLLFVTNSGGFFSFVQNDSSLCINRHDAVQLKIQFSAKKIRPIRTYLLLCGSAIGPSFATNQTYILEGRANDLGIANEYVIRSRLYQIHDRTLNIALPYNGATEYEIWISYDQPREPCSLRMTRWSDLRTRKVPRRLFLKQKSLITLEDAQSALLMVTVACISPTNRSFWLVFQSNIGDFIIQITSLWQMPLHDRIVVQWPTPTEACICSNSPGTTNTVCPYNIEISIPSRNTQLWSCVAQMFQKTLDSKERNFWSRYLDTYIGLRLIHWLMGDSTDHAALEFAHVFHTSVSYSIRTVDKKAYATVPETYTIQDVRPAEVETIMSAHIQPSIPDFYELGITLTSFSGREIRNYIVDLLRV